MLTWQKFTAVAQEPLPSTWGLTAALDHRGVPGLVAAVHDFNAVEVVHHASFAAEAEHLVVRHTGHAVTDAVAGVQWQRRCLRQPSERGKVQHEAVRQHGGQVPATSNNQPVIRRAVGRDAVNVSCMIEPGAGSNTLQLAADVLPAEVRCFSTCAEGPQIVVHLPCAAIATKQEHLGANLGGCEVRTRLRARALHLQLHPVLAVCVEQPGIVVSDALIQATKYQ